MGLSSHLGTCSLLRRLLYCLLLQGQPKEVLGVHHVVWVCRATRGTGCPPGFSRLAGPCTGARWVSTSTRQALSRSSGASTPSASSTWAGPVLGHFSSHVTVLRSRLPSPAACSFGDGRRGTMSIITAPHPHRHGKLLLLSEACALTRSATLWGERLYPL